MVELSVVMEKLSSFETANDLADFFRGYGIKAQPRNARSCAISMFVEIETGKLNITTNMSSVWFENDEGEQLEVFQHSEAMADFVEMYDTGYFTDLVEEGYEVNEMYNCCSDCG